MRQGTGAEREVGRKDGVQCDMEEAEFACLVLQVETHGLQQAATLPFKASKVFCIGTRPVRDLTHYLLENALEIRIFDRQLIAAQESLEEDAEEEAPDEGQDGEGTPKSRHPPLWSGLRSIDRARADEAEAPCKHGMASIDLSPLVKMASDKLSETAAVRPERNTHVGVYRRQLFPSAFLDCESSLTVQVHLSFPLTEYREKGNMQRLILALPYSDTERLWTLEKIVLERNCLALDGKTNVPLNKKLDPLLLKKSIGTVVLTEEQKLDGNLDIITGVQLIDGEFRVFVLEGLIKCTGYTDSQGVFTAQEQGAREEARGKSKPLSSSKNPKPPEDPVYTEKEGAMIQLLKALPRLNPNGTVDGTRIYWHPDLTFSKRLYADFHADIRKVRLREPLRALLSRQEIAIQPKYEASLNAMVRLYAMLGGTGSMKQVRELGGFPVPDMIVQMYKKFGAALTASDIDGVKKLSLAEKLGADAELSAEEVLQSAQGLPGRPRRKAPTDSKNEPYLEFIHIRAAAGVTDLIHANKETVAKMSEQSGLKDLRKFRTPACWVSGDLFQYASQSLNFTDLHKTVVRERLKLDYGKVHYTYSKDFLSGAYVLQEPEDAKREEAAANKSKWLTRDGFRTIVATRPQEFRTHASEWGEWRRSAAALLHDMDLDNLSDEWQDPAVKLQKLGSQPQEPLAQTLHGGMPFRRYFAQAAPQQHHLQGGVFGHNNAGFMDSVHREPGGGEAARLTRIAAEQGTFNAKVVGDRKYMMALLKQPAKLSQTDKFNYAANRDAPRTHYGKTLKGPEGITAAFPVSMLSLQEKWCDPAETSTVTKYGVSLRYKADIDGTNKTCEWKAAKAVGVKLHQRQHTIHSSKFDVRKVPVRDVVDAACNRYTQLAHAVRVRVQDHTIARAHTHKHTHTHTRGEGRQSLESVFAKTEGSRHTPYGAGYGSLHWSTARLLAASRGGLRHSSLTRLPTLLEASPGFGRLQQDRLHVYLVLPLACPPLIED